jgi:hypothetical protein
MVTDAKNFLGDWDMCDPVVWAILRVVHAQNHLTYAIDVVANNYNTASPRAVEAAISERREAIAALGQVLKQEPARDSDEETMARSRPWPLGP